MNKTIKTVLILFICFLSLTNYSLFSATNKKDIKNEDYMDFVPWERELDNTFVCFVIGNKVIILSPGEFRGRVYKSITSTSMEQAVTPKFLDLSTLEGKRILIHARNGLTGGSTLWGAGNLGEINNIEAYQIIQNQYIIDQNNKIMKLLSKDK